MGAFWIRLKHNWFRNLLAVLQVAIAIAAVSAVFIDVLPALKPAPAQASSQFTVHYGARTGMGVMFSSPFLSDDVDYLMEHATALEAASTYDSRFQAIVRVDDDRYMLRGLGRVHASFDRLVDLETVAGSFFVEEDVTAGPPRVAVISDELAQFLYGSAMAALGQTINVRPDEESQVLRGFAPPDMRASVLAEPGDDVQIIGVFRRTNELRGLGFVPGSDAVMLLPARGEEAGGLTRHVGQILVRARPGMEQAAEEEVKVLLASRLAERGEDERDSGGTPLGVMVEPIMGGAAMRQARLVNALVFGALGLAALIVSSIAMFTTTLANLTQRTRYIGLGRALGATRGRIVREVVAETALLAGLGGAVGAAAAFPLRATVLAPLLMVGGGSGLAVGDVLLVGLAGIGLAVAVGALAGLYPAWTVARLAPAEAWREGHM